MEYQEYHHHDGGEITQPIFYERLSETDQIALKVILALLFTGIAESGHRAGVMAIGSTTDLSCKGYHDIDLLIAAEDPKTGAKELRYSIRQALKTSYEVVELAADRKTVWMQVVNDERAARGSVFEITLPGQEHSWKDRLEHNRERNLSFCQLS